MVVSSSKSSMFSLKMILMMFVSLTILAMVASGYLGPRYGKRLPAGEVSRIVGRSTGPRTIQSRSQARFYAGSRYGGKRSYWPSVLATDMDNSEQNYPSNPPYDCFFVPYVGVRCAMRSEETPWQNGENDDDGPSMTRTSIISTGENSNNAPSAAAAVMGSEA